jgi:glycosyltransferase involved in cell wall biosynthesis
MEAMAVGLPVLLSDLDVFREVAGELPFYFNPEDPSAIAATIEKAFSNWNEMKARGEKGRSLVYSKASRHVYTRNLRSIYAELISVPTMLQPQVPAGIPARA